MYTRKTVLALIVMLCMMSFPALALSINLMTAEELKLRLDSNQPTILLDIQKRKAYTEHHFYGSIRTFAYPAKTDADLEKALQAVRLHEYTDNDIVVVGPRGGRASQRTVDFLISRDVPQEKVFILQGGINNWPYREMLLKQDGFLH